MRLMFFLIAAFCRLAKSLSHSQQIGWLVGAVGIEPTSEAWEDCSNFKSNTEAIWKEKGRLAMSRPVSLE